MHKSKIVLTALVAGVAVALAGPVPARAALTPAGVAVGVPAFDHIVIVVEENHSYDEVSSQPYLSSLAAGGANFTQAHAETHPSQPNYIALWSGSTQGITTDACTSLSGDNLGAQALAAGLSVAGYSESLPSAGSTACTSGAYAKKHNPVATFTQTADAEHNLPFSSFPSDYSTLPDVSLVVPNLNNDMHDGSVQVGDDWLRNNLGGYATWAKTHNSLLVVTFDEDDGTAGNKILNVLYGAHVVPGNYAASINHYNDLTTVEAALGLPSLNAAQPITDVWATATSNPVPTPTQTPTPTPGPTSPSSPETHAVPVADFSVAPGVSPNKVDLDATATRFSDDATAADYHWAFSNGSGYDSTYDSDSPVVDGVHLRKNQTYTITLTVTDSTGATSDPVSRTIEL
jgi:hypothetical protein